MIIELPSEAKHIIDTLGESGYEAFAVGGCVRDSLIGKPPKDWDVCTPALPEQTKKCFAGQRIVETGLKHGTVTLVLNQKPFEITTYRIDGDYSDNRRPDKVEFVKSLKEDLSRRDFTINAMAYSPKSGMVDFFGGEEDLKHGVIRCVGDAGKRFSEDALRIMRALRFAAVLGFSIETGTAEAMRESRGLLKNISVERIAAELSKLVTGAGAGRIMTEHMPVVAEIIPELAPAIGFEQNSPFHCYDVLTHIMKSVDSAPSDLHLRLTMLFHDIGKPARYSERDGTGHFYGHPQLSTDMAKGILTRLKYDNNTIDAVTQLILYHDADILPKKKHIKRWLNRIGEERLRQLIEVKRADAAAQSERYYEGKTAILDAALQAMDEIIGQRECFALKDLAVNGRDLIEAGVPEGRLIGATLNRLMDMVIDEEAPNDRAVLLEIARGLN